jgi:hypothetical protein
MAEHHFEKSIPYYADKGCPKGFHKRSEYTTTKGTYVPPRCVRATTPYEQSSKEFKRTATRKMKERLACPPGYIKRSPYVRRYSTAVRKQGYTVKRASGKTYKVFPETSGRYVGPSCIKDRGLPGKGVADGKAIGPLRKGELTQFGYSSKLPSDLRRLALEKAVKALGDLNVYHKLDAVAKLAVRVSPDSSRIFMADRDWVRKTFAPLKAF